MCNNLYEHCQTLLFAYFKVCCYVSLYDNITFIITCRDKKGQGCLVQPTNISPPTMLAMVWNYIKSCLYPLLIIVLGDLFIVYELIYFLVDFLQSSGEIPNMFTVFAFSLSLSLSLSLYLSISLSLSLFHVWGNGTYVVKWNMVNRTTYITNLHTYFNLTKQQ